VWAASQRRGRGMAWALVVLVTAAWLTVAAQADGDTTEATTAGTPSTSTTSAGPATAEPPATEPSPATSAPQPAPPPAGASIVDQLTIAPEGGDAGYDRDLFVHWTDADADGCDTRCEVLEAERRTDLPGLAGGGWLSIYDG